MNFTLVVCAINYDRQVHLENYQKFFILEKNVHAERKQLMGHKLLLSSFFRVFFIFA
mgnify:CR=1 FL=1